MNKIKLKMCGIFKDYLEEEIIISFEKKKKINYIKLYLIENYFINELKFLEAVLNKSVFSSNKKILSEDHEIKNNDIIYLLPPFSGG